MPESCWRPTQMVTAFVAIAAAAPSAVDGTSGDHRKSCCFSWADSQRLSFGQTWPVILVVISVISRIRNGSMDGHISSSTAVPPVPRQPVQFHLRTAPEIIETGTITLHVPAPQPAVFSAVWRSVIFGVAFLLHNYRGFEFQAVSFIGGLFCLFSWADQAHERTSNRCEPGAARITASEIFLVIGLLLLVGIVVGVDTVKANFGKSSGVR